MVHGYGYNRTRQALTSAGAETVWIDTSPKRPERNTMLTTRQAIREGDSLIVLHESDLGEDWRDRKRVMDILKQRGIHLIIAGNEPTRQDVGRPRTFDPTPEQDAEFGAIWYGPYTMAFVRAEYDRIFGAPLDRPAYGRLQYRYGPRDGSRWHPNVPGLDDTE